MPHVGQSASVGNLVDQSVQTALRVVEASNETLRDSVERGVDTAYRVVEEYMLRGRQHAGRHTERPNRETERVNDSNRQGGNGSTDNPWGAANPMMASWMQMMRMWTESMAAFMPGGGNLAVDWMNQFVPGGAPTSGFGAEAHRVVTVHVASPAPASVSVVLDAGAEYARLAVEPLRILGETVAPPLSSVSIECVAGEVKVSLSVPDAQPAGHYTGSIIDGMGAKRGELRADVEVIKRRRPTKKG